jgi:hypothetical protein
MKAETSETKSWAVRIEISRSSATNRTNFLIQIIYIVFIARFQLTKHVVRCL